MVKKYKSLDELLDDFDREIGRIFGKKVYVDGKRTQI